MKKIIFLIVLLSVSCAANKNTATNKKPTTGWIEIRCFSPNEYGKNIGINVKRQEHNFFIKGHVYAGKKIRQTAFLYEIPTGKYYIQTSTQKSEVNIVPKKIMVINMEISEMTKLSEKPWGFEYEAVVEVDIAPSEDGYLPYIPILTKE